MAHTDVVKGTNGGQSNRISGSFTAMGVSEICLIGNDFTLSLEGLGVAGSVTIQRSWDDGTSWKDVKTYSVDDEDNGYEPAMGRLSNGRAVKMSYRFECTAIDNLGEIFFMLGG